MGPIRTRPMSAPYACPGKIPPPTVESGRSPQLPRKQDSAQGG